VIVSYTVGLFALAIVALVRRERLLPPAEIHTFQLE
jgi:hypothetical protein